MVVRAKKVKGGEIRSGSAPLGDIISSSGGKMPGGNRIKSTNDHQVRKVKMRR